MSDNIQYLSFSNKVKVEVPQSSLTLQPHGLYSAWNAPDQNTAVGSLSLLQGIFPTQGLNLGLPYCRRILYQLSHRGSPFHKGSCFRCEVKLFETSLVS